MKIHEYQSKEILKKFGVLVPEGRVAFTPEEAENAALELKKGRYVVKAQIHAGGRGKGGGIRLVSNPQEVKDISGQMLGMKLVTAQTGSQGKIVKRILIEEGVDIEKELYLGIVLDRSESRYVLMASSEGGVEIEKIAAEFPEKIFKAYIDPMIGLASYQARNIGYLLGLEGKVLQKGVKFMLGLYDAFISCNCSLAEINPLVITSTGEVVALDTKINLDDNALFRHQDFMELRDIDEEEPLEVEASKYNLNYIKLDGTVGCMVNGAGLAMATMDLIKLAGAMPANFLDVGGGASVETVKNGFKIILSDKNVKGILINIFGGIVRCDRVAQGVMDAASDMNLKLPVVIRLEGTNKEQAEHLLKSSRFSFTVASNFQEAASKIVEIINREV